MMVAGRRRGTSAGSCEIMLHRDERTARDPTLLAAARRRQPLGCASDVGLDPFGSSRPGGCSSEDSEVIASSTSSPILPRQASPEGALLQLVTDDQRIVADHGPAGCRRRIDME